MKELIKRKKTIICLLVFVGLLTGSTSLAVLVNWPRSPLGNDLDGTSELHELIIYIYDWGVTLGGLAVFIVLIIAGMQYLTSAGKPETMRDAKDRIKNGIIGLVLLLSIYVILHTISPTLVTFEALDLNLEDYMTCDPGAAGDIECQRRLGEYFECNVNGYCSLNIDDFKDSFTPNPCESLAISTELMTGAPFNIENLEQNEKVAVPGGNYIQADTVINVTPKLHGDDKMCTATFTVYEGFLATRCAGKSHSHVIVATKDNMDYFPEKIEPGVEVKCVGHMVPEGQW